MSGFGRNKKPGRDGEWLITILRKTPEDEVQLVGNGLYWIRGDNSGGWSRLLTKLSTNRLIMDGNRAPKADSAIHDSLQDTYDSLVQRGFTLEIPKKPITYTQVVKELVEIGALPNPNASAPAAPPSAPPTPAIAPSVAVPVTQNVVVAPLAASPATQNPAAAPPQEGLHADASSTAPAPPTGPAPGEPSAPLPAAQDFVDEVDQNLALNNVVGGGAHDEPLYTEEVETSNNPTPDNTSGNDSLLHERIAALEEYAHDLEKQNRELHTAKLRAEERASAESVQDISKITNAVKASVDTGLTEMSGAMEFRLNREMGHIGKDLQDILRTGIQTPIDDLSIQMVGVTNSSSSCHNLLQEIIRKMGVLEQVQQNTATSLGQLGKNVEEILAINRAMKDLGSGSAPPPPRLHSTPIRTLGLPNRPAQQPVCEYCLAPGHAFTSCTSRPLGYMCVRCRSPKHMEQNCPTISLACSICKAIGHAQVLHATVNPEERMRICQKFGPNSLNMFKEFLQMPTSSKKLKLSHNSGQ